MKAIIKNDTGSIKYLLEDGCSILQGHKFTAVSSTNETDCEFIISDLYLSNSKVIENFPEIPSDFAPDAYLYNEATQEFTLNPDHPEYEERLAAQAE